MTQDKVVFAEQMMEGNLSPRVFGIGGGEVLESGERGQMTESRDQELAVVEGQAETDRATQFSQLTAGTVQGDADYANDGVEQAALARTWQGQEAVQTAEWRSGGGVRSSQTAYGYSEAYQDASHTDRETQRAWESAVDQDSAWRLVPVQGGSRRRTPTGASSTSRAPSAAPTARRGSAAGTSPSRIRSWPTGRWRARPTG